MNNKIIKAQSGWTTYLNPKNWGVEDIETKEFKDAFGLARKKGLKEFLWKGNRYNTRLISKKSLQEFDNSRKWLINYISNINPDSLPLNLIDSTEVDLLKWDNYKNKSNKVMDSLRKLGKDTLDVFKYVPINSAEPNSQDYNNYRKTKINKILDRLKNIDKSKLVVTDLPSKWTTTGYVLQNNNKPTKMYIDLSYPGTAVHELSHYSGADALFPIEHWTIDHPSRSDLYLLNPNEIGARQYQYKYLQSPNTPAKYGKMKFEGWVDNTLYKTPKDFNKNFHIK